MPHSQLLQSEIFGIYQQLPNIDSLEGQHFLRALSNNIAYKVGEFISMNICVECGKSNPISTPCMHCKNLHLKFKKVYNTY